MKVFYGFDSLDHFSCPVVTVGSYDGVHSGHRELLGRIVRMARESGGESVVVTFSPHPRVVLNHGADSLRLLNSLKEKIILLEQVGIDHLIVAPFTEEFSRVSSYNFIHDYLVGKIGVSTLVVGYNHHFGHNKEGNFDFLTQLQAKFGFRISEVSQQTIDRDKVSSTIIRSLICDGQIDIASRYLAHHYFIVAHYDTSGTIVLDEPHKLLPPVGRYLVSVSFDKTTNYTLYIYENGKLSIEPTNSSDCPQSGLGTLGKENDDFVITFC